MKPKMGSQNKPSRIGDAMLQEYTFLADSDISFLFPYLYELKWDSIVQCPNYNANIDVIRPVIELNT